MAGSSPRMWGTGPGIPATAGANRFIPTHVGNGEEQALKWYELPVHPHACGERTRRLAEARATAGSSPRMWGTARINRSQQFIPRFIPTHVGNGL